MPTREIEYTTHDPATRRLVAYAIRVTSEPTRYVAQVWEKHPEGGRRRVVPRVFSNIELPPADFFARRPHHRAEFVRMLQESLDRATALPLRGDEPLLTELFLGANVIGYPEGFDGAVEDDLSDWLHAAVIPDERASGPEADTLEQP